MPSCEFQEYDSHQPEEEESEQIAIHESEIHEQGRVPFLVSKIEEAISPKVHVNSVPSEYAHLSVSKNITRRRLNQSVLKSKSKIPEKFDISSLDLSNPVNSPLLKREFEGDQNLILQTPFKAREILERNFAQPAGHGSNIFDNNSESYQQYSSSSSYLA